ncbi:Cyclic di-GMP phosphodiesterase response regulator RpfG [Thalassoglobus polymorphus]|uniref:Cyclic di-GMP phosphodiesterase response regulator RpfG n=1 Tax=Thalassoglobus polymorphus TaxID=2527994 RepID=A0A517QPU0_9PLAN|nr:Cyclic di-GMP phosphodiesterase response regulator RpfG [Thalassoglobus polymorphus]
MNINTRQSSIIGKAIELSSKSMGTTFTQIPSQLSPRGTERPDPVKVNVENLGSSFEVRFIFHDRDGDSVTISGIICSREEELVRRLAKTTAELIQKDIQIQDHESSLDDYASQISRDFEELVWTRELANHIQQTDLRNPLFELVDQIFPTLLDTIQASQLSLIQYDSPIIPSGENDPIPTGQLSFRHVGNEILDQASIQSLLKRYSHQARLHPIVKNQCSTSQIVQLRSFILVPIYSRNEEFGWVLAINRTDSADVLPSYSDVRKHDRHQPEFGTFEAGLMQSSASFIASHAKNSTLLLEQKDLLVGIVRVMINTVDAKDHYTCGHSDRVAALSRVIAANLQLCERECEEIYLSGLLHDVGKIGIPDHVLQKTNRLTQNEYHLLKQHPVIGARVLKHLSQISYVLPGVLYHHEQINGSGYPEGLVGEQIPLSARIISVADSYDAMTSDRPYRKGMSAETARSILEKNEGPQWDENVLNAFFQAWDEIQEICMDTSQSNLSLKTTMPADLISRAVEMTHTGPGVETV